MNRKDFIKKYSEKNYLGDGLYITFDGFDFILSKLRVNGVNWVCLEPTVFDNLLLYRQQVYSDAENLIDDSNV